MRQKTNKLSKIIFPIMCMLVFACAPLCFALSSRSVVFAATTSDIENVSITNADFDSSSSGSLQTSPSGWTAIGQTENVKMGIISVDETDFSNYKSGFGLEAGQNPGRGGTTSGDKHVLMINAKDNYAKSGFESASSTSLDANSYYVVSINAKTTSSSFASIYIDGLVDEYVSDNCYREIVFPQWTKLNFFIKTGSTSKDVKIQMYLGSKSTPSTSVVFFDNIEFVKTSEKTYNNLLSQQIDENALREESAKTYREINIGSENIDITYQIDNADFNNPSVNVFSPISETIAKFVDVTSDARYSNLSSDNEFAFSIKNEQKEYSCYELKDIVIPAYGVYALSIDAKIIQSLSSSNATLKLVESDDITEEFSDYEPKSAELNLTSDSNSTKNDFNTYTFFVKGNGLVDTKFSLQIALGTSDEKVTGEIALDDIKFFSTTSSKMEAASGSFQTTLELQIASSSPLVSNGHFNNYIVEDPVEFLGDTPNYSFPFGAQDWKHEVEDDVEDSSYAFGVVNTKSSMFDATKIGIANPLNPGFNIDQSNNILMFKNSASTHQSASLSSLSLDSSSIYELTFDVNTQLTAGVMSFSLLSDNKAISKFSSISTNGAWKSYKVAIRTNSVSSEIGIKFDFGTKEQNALGFGFVDNVRLVKKTLSDEQFLALTNATNTKIVDFEKGNWNIVSDTQNSFGVWELLTASSSLADNAFAGVIAGKDNAFDVTSANEENMLIVSNPEQGTSSITTKNDFHFESGKFYKISINILTQRVQTLEQNEDDDEKIDFGASIKLSGFDTKLENIVTDGQFKTFVFLVKATEDSDQGLTLTLSSPTSTTLGTVIADNLVVEELEESAYNEAVELKTSKNQTNVAVAEVVETDEDDDEEESADSGLTNSEIWLLVPSIIFGVMIIFAILAFTLRHIKVKKFEKATQANYNRKSSLEREKAKIEAKKNIDKQIAEQVELQKIVENELKSLEENYQKDLQEFRASGNAKSSKMEKEFKSYMNQKSKLDATLSSIKEKIKQLENPEVLVLEEKKIFSKYQKEQERVDRHIKRETKKLEKDKKKNNK